LTLHHPQEAEANAAAYSGPAFICRDFNPDEDMNFVMHSYMKGFWEFGMRQAGRKGGYPIDCLQNADYGANQKSVIENLLQIGKCIVACPPDDHFLIFGYLIGELNQDHPVVHYVSVKSKYRRQGKAAGLISEFENMHGGSPEGVRRRLIFSHWTDPWGARLLQHLKKQGYAPIWNPYLAR